MTLITVYGKKVEAKAVPISNTAKTQKGNIYEVRVQYSVPALIDWIADAVVKRAAPALIKLADKLNNKIRVLWVGVDTAKNIIYIQFEDIGELQMAAIGAAIINILRAALAWMSIIGVSYFILSAVKKPPAPPPKPPAPPAPAPPQNGEGEPTPSTPEKPKDSKAAKLITAAAIAYAAAKALSRGEQQ